MGTLLDSRGYDLPAPVWSAKILEEEPEAITNIHREYLDAGAQLLTTATFRTTEYVYQQVGTPKIAKDLNSRAVQCARDAIGDQENRFVAGSIAPIEDCYRPDMVPERETLYSEHRKQAEWLVDAGVDCLLFETMNSIGEAAVCGRIGEELGTPTFISYTANSVDTILSGEPVRDAMESAAQFNSLGVLINCTRPEITAAILSQYSGTVDMPLGGYANLGLSNPEQGGTISGTLAPEEYAKIVSRWPIDNLALVGACCGSTPEHIRALADLFS